MIPISTKRTAIIILLAIGAAAQSANHYVGVAATGDSSGSSRSNLMAIVTFIGTHASPDDVGLVQVGDYRSLGAGVLHITKDRLGTSWTHPITLQIDTGSPGYTARSSDWKTRTTKLEEPDPAKHAVFSVIEFDENCSGGDDNVALPYYWIIDGLWLDGYIYHNISNASIKVKNCNVLTYWTGYASTSCPYAIYFRHYSGGGSDMHDITYEDCYTWGGGRSLKIEGIIRSGGLTASGCRFTSCSGSFIGDCPWNWERYADVIFEDCVFDKFIGVAYDTSGYYTDRNIIEVDPANPRTHFRVESDVSPDGYLIWIDWTHGGTAKQGLMQLGVPQFNHSTHWVTLLTSAPWDLTTSDIARFYCDGHGSGWAMYGDRVKVRRSVLANLGDSGTTYTYKADGTGQGNNDCEMTDCLIYSGGNIWGCRFDGYTQLGNNFICKGNTFIGRKETDDAARPWCHYGRIIYWGFGPLTDTSTCNFSNNLVVGLFCGDSLGSAIRCNNIIYAHSYSVTSYGNPGEFLANGGATNQGNVVIYNGETLGNEPHPFDKTGTYFVASASNFDDVFTDWPFNYNLSTDFQPEAGSPAIATGSTTYKTATDLGGTARSSPPTVGAWEYSGASSYPPTAATAPSPADLSTGQSKTSTLSWTSGENDPNHRVFFGTSESDVTNGSGGTDKGTQANAVVTYNPGTLANYTTYYWRIKEWNMDGSVDGTVWRFTTLIGSPVTVNPGGGANFTTLSAAEAALPNPLDDDYVIYLLGSTADTTQVVIDVATLNGATQHTLTVVGNNTTGKPSTAYYRINYASTGNTVTIASNHVTFKNVEVIGSATPTNGIYVTGNNVTVEKCVVHGFTQAGYAGICLATGTTDRYMWNNVCYGNSRGIWVNNTQAGIFHNTCVGNSQYGIFITEGGTVTVKDNLCSGNTVEDYDRSGD
jgi:hypothetical protein